jgi:hypothetical protein
VQIIPVAILLLVTLQLNTDLTFGLKPTIQLEATMTFLYIQCSQQKVEQKINFKIKQQEKSTKTAFPKHFEFIINGRCPLDCYKKTTSNC